MCSRKKRKSADNIFDIIFNYPKNIWTESGLCLFLEPDTEPFPTSRHPFFPDRTSKVYNYRLVISGKNDKFSRIDL